MSLEQKIQFTEIPMLSILVQTKYLFMIQYDLIVKDRLIKSPQSDVSSEKLKLVAYLYLFKIKKI